MDHLFQVVDSVLNAGRILAAEWQRPNGPRGAGDKADVDIEIEQVLHADLLGLLDCDFWGEETESHLSGAEYCWVVDPNDGTAEFLNGNRGLAISVGLLCGVEPILGVVYAPVTDDRGPDCIAWEVGMPAILRNGQEIQSRLLNKDLTPGSQVLMSTAAKTKPQLNAELCAPGGLSQCEALPTAWRSQRPATP